MTTRCQARMCMPWEKNCFSLYQETPEGRKEKFQIGIEKGCQFEAAPGQIVCFDHIKRIADKKYQAASTTDHGILGGPYTSNSKLYGSPYYLDLLKKGWKIKPEDKERAKAAIEKACSNMPPKKSKVPVVAEAAAPAVTEEKPKAVRKIRVSKKAAAAAAAVDPPLPVQSIVTEAPTLTEAMSVPIVPQEVVRVKVKKMRLEGKEYFVAMNSGKVYTIGSHGMPEKYKGRYVAPADSESSAKLDTNYPDSDAE